MLQLQALDWVEKAAFDSSELVKHTNGGFLQPRPLGVLGYHGHLWDGRGEEAMIMAPRDVFFDQPIFPEQTILTMPDLSEITTGLTNQQKLKLNTMLEASMAANRAAV